VSVVNRRARVEVRETSSNPNPHSATLRDRSNFVFVPDETDVGAAAGAASRGPAENRRRVVDGGRHARHVGGRRGHATERDDAIEDGGWTSGGV